MFARTGFAGWLAIQTAHASSCGVPVLPALAHAGPNPNPQTVFLLDPKTYPQALCNDGSPGGYIFRPGSGDGTQRWIFQLQGGGACEDNASCAARQKSLISTRGLISGVSPGATLDGVLSADPGVNPDFYDANAVRVLYCSSDYWTGDKVPSQRPFDRKNAASTWYFQGRAIAIAALQDLAAKGAGSATEWLLTGDSAGGVGIVLDANDLLKLLPRQVRAVVAGDAGYMLDIGAYDANSPQTDYVSTAKPTPLESIISTGLAFWGGRGDAVCDASAHTLAEHELCYHTDQIITQAYLAPPVGSAEAQQDEAQLLYDGLPPGRPQKGTSTGVYAKAFAAGMSASLQATGPYNASYGPDAWMHEMLTGSQNGKPSFDTPHDFPGNASITPQQALGNWYLDPCAGEKLVGK